MSIYGDGFFETKLGWVGVSGAFSRKPTVRWSLLSRVGI